jgi:hypothetical protein
LPLFQRCSSRVVTILVQPARVVVVVPAVVAVRLSVQVVQVVSEALQASVAQASAELLMCRQVSAERRPRQVEPAVQRQLLVLVGPAAAETTKQSRSNRVV